MPAVVRDNSGAEKGGAIEPPVPRAVYGPLRRRSCPTVPARTCTVTLTDIRGVKHSVEVTAETVFEAATPLDAQA